MAFLFSIAGLSVTLAGFSGLVAAFRRGSDWKPMDAYRLRQIPEMGLTTAALTLITVPLTDTTRNPTAAIQVVSGAALLFTVWHIAVLALRTRRQGLAMAGARMAGASVIDIIVIGTGAIALALGAPAAFEWLLVALLARPMLAFVLVLTELPAS